MYIIRDGGQNNKVILKFSNYLGYFQKKFWKFGDGGSPPWSSSGYATSRPPIIYDLQLLAQTYRDCLALLFKLQLLAQTITLMTRIFIILKHVFS